MSVISVANGVELELDISYNNIEHAWTARGSDKAHFDRVNYGIGATVWSESNRWGFRTAYLKGGNAYTEGRYEGWTLDMEYIISFELIYKREIFNDFYAFTGIGHNIIPMPIYGLEGQLVKDDDDDDEGYFFGVTKMFTKHHGVTARWTKYSNIQQRRPFPHLNEYIKGTSFNYVYRF